MREEDEGDGGQNDSAVDALLVCAVEQPEIAYQQRDLEETDTHLVNRSAGEVDSGERYEVLVWACFQRESKPEPCLCDIAAY